MRTDYRALTWLHLFKDTRTSISKTQTPVICFHQHLLPPTTGNLNAIDVDILPDIVKRAQAEDNSTQALIQAYQDTLIIQDGALFDKAKDGHLAHRLYGSEAIRPRVLHEMHDALGHPG